MWIYEKKLQYPVKIKNPNPALAKLIISQYGGPHGEIGASLRYLSQRYSMPYPELRAILTDVGTEGLKRNTKIRTDPNLLLPEIGSVLFYTNRWAYPQRRHRSSEARCSVKPFTMAFARADPKISSKDSVNTLPRSITPSLSRQQGTTVPSDKMPK